MPLPYNGASDGIARKQAPRSRTRGKEGERAVAAALEAANQVVQLVDRDNDVGRDAFVDIVIGTGVTGGVISLQIKSGPSFHRGGHWVLPGADSDFTLWRESSVPFFGVVHDPDDGALRWIDLADAARTDTDLSRTVPGPFGQRAYVAPDGNRLDLDVESFLYAVHQALRGSGLPVHALLSDNAETVAIGIADTFVVGRREPEAFLLLGALFQRLPEDCRPLALRAMAMATRHPDIFWTNSNWIPDGIKQSVGTRLRWSGDDLEALLALVDDDGIQRGTVGQDVFHVMELDSGVADKLVSLAADPRRPDGARLWAAVVALYLAGDDASDRLVELVRQAPDLAHLRHFKVLEDAIRQWGYLSLF